MCPCQKSASGSCGCCSPKRVPPARSSFPESYYRCAADSTASRHCPASRATPAIVGLTAHEDRHLERRALDVRCAGAR